MTIAFRNAELRDRSLIVSGWSSSLRDAHAAGLIAMDDWAEVMHRQIVQILDRGDACTTIVAYETDEEPGSLVDLYGFIAADVRDPRPLVFYVFVKQGYRRAGVARGLFRAAGIDPAKPFDYACKTGASARLVNKIPLAAWHPLRARYAPDDPRSRGDHRAR